MLDAIGFEHVIELSELQSLQLPGGGKITGVPFPGEHGDLDVLTKLAYVVQLEQTSALFAADSNNLDPRVYERIAPLIGMVDHLFIGVECAGAPLSWLYGPLYDRPLERQHDQSRRLNGSNAERAWTIVEALKPAAVHVYAMGAEPWLTFISSVEYTAESVAIVESDELVRRCLAAAIPAERLFGQVDWSCGDARPTLALVREAKR